ncbi:TssN family type VI secretion system protein [Flavobacterium sp. DG1-102-2]|uniref:TssN family type VI secretion system protein n=1 Tax=Flavobacterium sp. DG1-102-2 TaxID=3081663 RepID=UPI00294A437B|nr:TssN family type VI secretion system protein [Flavobacterium sp. DG1-102-2]MDV6167390.1 TssN family type VI secretion system protein [Flavobacterium sp. DG1-102-2]
MRKYLSQIGGGEAMLYIFIAIAFAMIACALLATKIPKMRQEKKKYFFYTVLQGLFFIIFGAILYNLKNTSLNARFISIQSYMLIAGIIQVLAFRHFFQRFETRAIIKEIGVAVVSAIFQAAFLIMVVVHFRELTYMYYLLGTLLFFIVPTLCYCLFETAVSIPAKLHKRWFYPVNFKYPAPQASDMRNVIILNFVFQKKENDKDFINFKVKAPRAFEFGKLFYYFINDYNEKNPNSQIRYMDNKDEPYGWYFYTKPKWFGSSDYIDPELAIDTNNIKDGETIICQRI